MLKILADYRGKIIVQESFLDSNHMSGRTTGKNVTEHIINILKNMKLILITVGDKLTTMQVL